MSLNPCTEIFTAVVTDTHIQKALLLLLTEIRMQQSLVLIRCIERLIEIDLVPVPRLC